MFVNGGGGCGGGGGGRAMKPPGGESHDLWGAEFKGTPCHHRVLKPPGGGTSDIFGAPEPAQNSPRRARNAMMQSSVFGPSSNDGNPVTGEGYTNGEKQPPANNALPAAPTTNGTSHSAPPQRNRVPPGGFSSGLW